MTTMVFERSASESCLSGVGEVGRIVYDSTARFLVAAPVERSTISLRTLNMMDASVASLRNGVVSEPIDLTERFDFEDEAD